MAREYIPTLSEEEVELIVDVLRLEVQEMAKEYHKKAEKIESLISRLRREEPIPEVDNEELMGKYALPDKKAF